MAKRKSKKKQAAKEAVPQQPRVEIDPETAVEEQVPLNELPTLLPNSYEVVVAAARRARQLNLGLRPLVKTNMARPVDVALAELVAGQVEYVMEDDEPRRDAGAPKRRSKSKQS
jgi:DNA-directed RNA polymerase omega subunit